MPRTARVDAPGALHHVMVRGIERREIFRDDADRWNLIERLSRLVPEWGGACFAWVLMGNHVHLVLRTGVLPLAWLMRRLNTGFATRFNQRHERVGYLFQNRFKSRLVTDEADLLNLVRYVHLNPLRGGLVPDVDGLERFPWSGHGALVGQRKPFPFESVGLVLALFDENRAVARRRLRSWMALALDRENAPMGELVEAEPPDRPSNAARRGHGSGARRREAGASLDQLIDDVSRRFATPRSEIERGARHERATQARAVIAFVAVVRRGLPITEVAARVGVSPQAVGKSIERGAGLAIDEELGPREES